MKNTLKNYFSENKKIRKIVGIFLILIGFIALLSPFTPGSWLIFIGLEFLGIRSFWGNKIKTRFKK